MSEFAPRAPKHYEVLPAPEQHEALPTAAQAEPLRPGEADPLQQLEAARQAVEQTAEQANPLKQFQAAQEAAASPQPLPASKELRAITLNRELTAIRRRLPRSERAFSKVIHQPAIRAVSAGAGKTVTRPSGLLGGGIVAFLGTAGYVYFTKYIGLRYNYLLFLLFFVGGFVLGLCIELIVWLATNRKATAMGP